MLKTAIHILLVIFTLSFDTLYAQQVQTEDITIDFTDPEVVKQWQPLHHIKTFKPTNEGIEIQVEGEDPYFAGPPLNLASNYPLWMILKLWSEKGGMTQIFYFRNIATEEDSIRLDVPPQTWYVVELPLPKLGSGYRFRIDPAGNSGKFILNRISFEPRKEFTVPRWKWTTNRVSEEPSLRSGKLVMHLNKESPFGYEFRIENEPVGRGLEDFRIGYLFNKELFWVSIKQSDVNIEVDDKSVKIIAQFKDLHDGNWKISQKFVPLENEVIEMTTEFECSQIRQVMFLPLHLLAVGQFTWKTNKTQALFAGLEYLENELSSSQADIRGPESNRQTPMPHKVTFPLMSITHNGYYIALIWDNHSGVAPVFDSPDRIFNSGGHIMGILFPGWDGTRRIEGTLLPGAGATIIKGRKVTSKAYIISGAGATVVPSIQRYVKLKGLPELPETGVAFFDYVNLTAYGWLKSKIRENNFYRHAYWQGFNPMPAADAAFCEEWLSLFVPDSLSSELINASTGAIGAVNEQNYYNSSVGHIRIPVAPLVYGNVEASIKSAYQTAKHHLSRFNADGIVVYKAGATDYGRTHFTNHASGLTAHAVVNAIEAAVFCGDRDLIDESLKRLKQLSIYDNGVPRGAQTWEIPLHTPDILASAHLVKAFVIGYELTGDKLLLDRAIYWAWTGVPFVYLTNPGGRKVWNYSTIAVYGATSWVAPVWMGLPVQWCGLVYADALYWLAKHDPDGIWMKLADGITAAGIQHTYPLDNTDLAGLLPDSFALREQQRNPPAINPATLQVCAVRYYKQIPLYDFKGMASAGLNIHAPGRISVGSKERNTCEFSVTPWTRKQYYILVNGMNAFSRLIVNNKEIKTSNLIQDPPSAVFTGKNLIIKCGGSVKVQIIL